MAATNAPELDRAAIVEIVRGLDPIDWVQMELLARLPPEERILPGMRAQEFARSLVRGAIMERFPELSPSEVNMRVLVHFTTVQMERK